MPDSVMVAQKILALFVEVRILVGQPGGGRVSQAEWVLEAALRKKAYLIKSITTQTKKRKIGMPL